MEKYDDARGFGEKLNEQKAFAFADRNLPGPNAVGFDEETMSYAPVVSQPGKEVEDSGVRIKFTPYAKLVPPERSNQGRRVAIADLFTPESDTIFQISGIYVNAHPNGTFLHWPSARFGYTNHLMVAYKGEQFSMAPLIVMAFNMWLDEKEAADVKEFMERYFANQSGR